MIPENHGYQVIHRLQMGHHGREFGNEFRYRKGTLDLGVDKASQPRLDGDYLEVDLVQVAPGLGARGVRATTAAEVRAALDETRGHQGPVVIVVPVIPHIDLPGAGCVVGRRSRRRCRRTRPCSACAPSTSRAVQAALVGLDSSSFRIFREKRFRDE